METLIVYVIIIAAFCVTLTALAGVIKFILRGFAKNVRFLLCLVLALVCICTFFFGLSKSPLSSVSEDSLLNEAVKEFGGVYSSKLPVFAYRFKQADEQAHSDDGTETVRIKIDYLPVGSAEIEYDPEHGRFRLSKPLEIAFLKKFQSESGNIKLPDIDASGLTEAAESVKEAAGEKLDELKEKASGASLPGIDMSGLKEKAADALDGLADKLR